MTIGTRRLILRADGLYLGISAVLGLVAMDLPGIVFGWGPEARVLGSAPYAGVGFVEAHGLALILSILLWRAAPTRDWHITGAVAAALLGIANVVSWPIFVTADALPVGYLSTSLHWTFAILQACAAVAARHNDVVRVDRERIVA